MKKTALHAAKLGLLGLALLTLSSCTSPKKAEYVAPDLDSSSITTIGVFPITYTRNYEPPLVVDLKGMDLSKIILRESERVLSKKGYQLKLVEMPAEILKEDRLVPLKIYPSTLARLAPPDVDGLMQIHVNFHFGLEPTERSGNDGPISRIYLIATARLISRSEAQELWRDKGRARPYITKDFYLRFRYATNTLANGLFATLPERQ